MTLGSISLVLSGISLALSIYAVVTARKALKLADQALASISYLGAL